jgi:hypothetical protein
MEAIIGSDMETMSGFTGIVPILFSRSSDICFFPSYPMMDFPQIKGPLCKKHQNSSDFDTFDPCIMVE